MRKFYTGIVNNRKKMIGLYVFAAIICAILQSLVSVNYDINDYLPDESHSTISLEVMQEEFDGGIPNARVMIRDVSIPEALEYKEELEEIDGVQEVSWLDDVVDITEPLSTLDRDTVETYYNEETALFTVTLDEEKQLTAVSEIRNIIGDENAMTGSSISTVTATLSTVREIGKIAAFAVAFVFTFMPCLILVACKLMDKLRHRSFVPDLHGFGKVVRKLMIPMVCIFAVVIIPAYLASNSNDYYYGAGHMFGEKTQYSTDTLAIEEIFGQNDTYVLLVPCGNTAVESQLSDDLHELPQVTSIISYVDMAGAEIPQEYLDEDTLALLQSDNYSRMVINVEADFEGEETFSLVKQIRELANTYYPDAYYLAGQGVSTYDLRNTVTADMVKVNFVAILAVYVVLLLLTKKLVLPVILVLSIETAIWINVGFPYFMGNHVFYIAYLIISSIQLGATVDYAILMSDRYREFRSIYDKRTAIVETVSAVTVSIMTTGSVFSVVGFLLGYVSSNELLAQLGVFLGVGGLCSGVIVLFVLPGLLYLFDKLFVKNQEVV